MTPWNYVKDFYKQNFGIDGWVVELYANLDVLALCSAGASNKSISEICQLDLDDIVEILMNTFKFPGWEKDLPNNPYKTYTELETSLAQESKHHLERTFISCMYSALSGYKQEEKKDIIYKSYWICRTMREIEERIADEWI